MIYSNLAILDTIFSILAVLFRLLWKYWRTRFFKLMAFPTYMISSCLSCMR